MLFLFDIDGTLVRRMPPAHRDAICEAMRAIFDMDLGPEDLGQTAGMTDTAIVRRALLAAGVAPGVIAEGLPQCFATAVEAYDRLVAPDLRPYQTPAAAETLAWLVARGASLGLVTGNVQGIAWRKLAAAGLAEPFACGAFGDEAEAREALPPLALRRATEVFGRTFPPEQVYVVGDTPADIACGAASALRTIAVATGPVHSMEQLRACSPTFVIEDLHALASLPL